MARNKAAQNSVALHRFRSGQCNEIRILGAPRSVRQFHTTRGLYCCVVVSGRSSSEAMSPPSLFFMAVARSCSSIIISTCRVWMSR